MQYALLIYTEPGYDEKLTDDELAAMIGEYRALAEGPETFGSAQLQPVETATSVRVNGGRTLVTDGPFADTKEVLGGILLIEAPNLDKAIEMAERIPAARLGGCVEVRPVVPR